MSANEIISTLHSLRLDISEEEIKQLILNSDRYYELYPDVKKAGLCAVDHFFRHGEAEGRTWCFPELSFSEKYSRKVDGKKTIYTTLPTNSGSFFYRGIFSKGNDKESLVLNCEANTAEILTGIFSAKDVILLRPTNTEKMQYLIKLCRQLGVRLSIDLDDLLLPEYIDNLGEIRSHTINKKQTFEQLIKDSALILAADELICSTQKIAELHNGMVEKITVSKNRLPAHFFKKKKLILNYILKNRKKKTKLLYLSGSPSHKKDFSLISGVLLRLAQEIPSRFSISFFGKLHDHSVIFNTLGCESNFIPLHDFDNMLKTIREHDLVLVPLESTIFNEAKSNIKFIEAASQGVPIIASATSEYCSCIQDSINGWLCNSEEEWYEKLKFIISTPSVIYKAGLSAHETALKEFNIQ
ncbi:glycosyltransferase [Lonsdalea quercina]|uniref:glycosyltransferase n=1 Tax=Lonsdalea quercina TaxID=71657 RepID=UPI003974E906